MPISLDTITNLFANPRSEFIANSSSYVEINSSYQPPVGDVFTAAAWCTVPVNYDASGDVNSDSFSSRSICIGNQALILRSKAPSSVGTHLVRFFAVRGAAADTLRLGGGGVDGNTVVWHGLTIVNGLHPDLLPFSGATEPFRFRQQVVTPRWNGATDNSSSYFELAPSWDPLLVWGKTGERKYAVGVDRGVLFLDGEGMAWDGIVSVDESPTGGEGKAYYMDGAKRFIVPSPEEFEATLEAYSAPSEFSVCEGKGSLIPGFYAGQQRRKPFSFVYRTLLGNDIWQNDYGYELHLVYNAFVEASPVTNTTLGDKTDPVVKRWPIKAVPLRGISAIPTSHFVINSLEVIWQNLSILESIIYGYDNEAPRLPLPDEVADILNG